MEEFRSFFNNPTPSRSQLTRLEPPLTAGLCLTKEDPINELNRPEEHRHSFITTGADYARKVRDKETAMYLKNVLDHNNWESVSSGLESLEHLSSCYASQMNIEELTDEAMNEVYSKYSFKMKEDSVRLTIQSYRQGILDCVNGFPVSIIEGPTGCGKTTQVPQWILDDMYQKRKPCKIIVTQPRRIAAISIAKRVAHERGWDVGGIVGYQVGLENRTTNDTCIHYVTTGVLLQKLVAAKTMNGYTHVILDEVHERGQEMDFLLLIVKKFLYTVSPNVRVILMSATFNKKNFLNYFLMPRHFAIEKKETMFTVKTFYLNHLTKFGNITNMVMNKEEPGIAPEMHWLVIKLLNAFERIDVQEESYDDRGTADLASVLIFLPGINEIEDLFVSLNDTKLREKIVDAQCASYKWWVLPLHSTITADEQARVFQRAAPGTRKIILSTNIAESSITVPDIKYVIDFCLMKMLVADPATNFTSLQVSWASKTNCSQRAGRAGRVRDGRVYRLVTDKFYEQLPQECPPEIQRCPLERLVLLAKMLDMGPPRDILALAMDPPDLSNIFRTVLVLKEVGALKNKEPGAELADGELTYLGRVMAKLPLDVRASKLIVLGHVFGCLDECVVMAAAMSVKSVFSSPFRERLNAYNSKLTWADGSTSDSIAFYNVYKVWNHLRQQNAFREPANNEGQWSRRFYVQARALRELDDLVRELRSRLSREGIESTNQPSPWAYSEQSLVLKILIAGAMYPQYFVQVSTDEARERDALRTLGGHDPRHTVYLKNFPEQQPGEVYSAAICRAVRAQIGDEPKVYFDSNSRKVFLTFGDAMSSRRGPGGADAKDPTIPGQVVLPVYKCIKARQLKMDIRIPLLPPERANELARSLETEQSCVNMERFVPRLPDIDDSHFPLKICEIIDVGRFWAIYDDESTSTESQAIHRGLNSGRLVAYTGALATALGAVLAAPHADSRGQTMRRVRVTKLLPKGMVEVLYLDHGGVSRVNAANLMEVPGGVCRGPPLAMQCRLAALAPAPLLERHGGWGQAAANVFREMTTGGHNIGKVYSVSHGVVALELLAASGRSSVNGELLARGLAVPSEETYDSKLNHDLRERATELNMSQKRAHNREQAQQAFCGAPDLEPPDARDCYSDVFLKGPFSPLETTVHNVMYASREKQVNIEWHSVNSVLLDTEPQETYARLLVAAEVGQNELSSKLTLRHTTLMPNVPGLPAIIALLFCPMAELRRSPAGCRYVSALCGLGGAASGAPRFPEHDLLVDIDADLTVEDIGTINHVRHLMDYMLYCGEGEDTPSANEYRPQVPKHIRKDIMSLLRKRRKHREPVAVPRAWEWNSVDESQLLELTQSDMERYATLFPLHAPQELRERTLDQLQQLAKENEELKVLVARSAISSTAQLTCKLCNTPPMAAHGMRIHLYSNGHKEKEDDLAPVRS